jgi:type VI secretion system secreted protein Hcp
MAVSEFADNFMWFPDDWGTRGTANPAGETADAWFRKKKAFELLSFKFVLRQSEVDVDIDSEDSEESSDGALPDMFRTERPGKGAAPGKGATKKKPFTAGFREFQVQKSVDFASPMLYRACAEKDPLPTAFIAVRKAGGNNLLYLQYMFRKVIICEMQWESGGSAGSEAPKETLKLTCEAMGMQYVQQLAGGKAGDRIRWDWNPGNSSATLEIKDVEKAPQFMMPTQHFVS